MTPAGTDIWRTAVLAVAGLCGAAGVSLAAVAAHRVQSPALGSASLMLMVHAATAVAIIAAGARVTREIYWLAAASLMLLGAVLFGGDISLSAFTGSHLFPMEKPLATAAAVEAALRNLGA